MRHITTNTMILKSFESSWEKDIVISSHQIAGERVTKGIAGCKQSTQVGSSPDSVGRGGSGRRLRFGFPGENTYVDI